MRAPSSSITGLWMGVCACACAAGRIQQHKAHCASVDHIDAACVLQQSRAEASPVSSQRRGLGAAKNTTTPLDATTGSTRSRAARHQSQHDYHGVRCLTDCPRVAHKVCGACLAPSAFAFQHRSPLLTHHQPRLLGCQSWPGHPLGAGRRRCTQSRSRFRGSP